MSLIGTSGLGFKGLGFRVQGCLTYHKGFYNGSLGVQRFRIRAFGVWDLLEFV